MVRTMSQKLQQLLKRKMDALKVSILHNMTMTWLVRERSFNLMLLGYTDEIYRLWSNWYSTNCPPCLYVFNLVLLGYINEIYRLWFNWYSENCPPCLNVFSTIRIRANLHAVSLLSHLSMLVIVTAPNSLDFTTHFELNSYAIILSVSLHHSSSPSSYWPAYCYCYVIFCITLKLFVNEFC